MNMKMKGWVRSYRQEVELEKALNDSELRIYFILRRISAWDLHHEKFGTAEITVRGFRVYLPAQEWSPTKIQYALTGLISKGYITRVKRGCLRLTDSWLLTKKSQLAEQFFQEVEQGIPLAELRVQYTEQIANLRNRIKYKEMKTRATGGRILFNELNKSPP